MNKLYLTLTICVIAISQSFAQRMIPRLEEKIYPGTITTLDGQTVKGYVLSSRYNNIQKECVFYTDYQDNRSRKTYHPNDILGYSIENYQFKSINYSGNLGFGKANKNFVYLAQPGAISTYIYNGESGEQVFWQKGEGEPVSNASMFMGFKKNALKLVGDYPELAAKIEAKEKGYGMINLDKIIEEYNTWAESKK